MHEVPTETTSEPLQAMTDPTLTDLDLARRAFAVSGTRVRCRPELDAVQAEALISRGLAELSDDCDAFVPGEASRCLRATQYGFDLLLGRVDP